MHKTPRHYLPAVIGSALAALTTIAPALAFDPTIQSQASMGLSQVQQLAASGQITPSQANDLINRYNRILSNNQTWSMQDGGNLNSPDRRSLMGQLSKVQNMTQSFMQGNGTLFGGVSNIVGMQNGMFPGASLNNVGYNSGYNGAYGGGFGAGGGSCGGGGRHHGRGNAYGHHRNGFNNNYGNYNSAYGNANGYLNNGYLNNGAYSNAYGNILSNGLGGYNGYGYGNGLSGMLNSGSGIGGALRNVLGY